MQSFHFFQMSTLQVLNILSLIALVFVFTVTANPAAEEHGKIVFTFYYLRRTISYCFG
jgi:hypothetical protein